MNEMSKESKINKNTIQQEFSRSPTCKFLLDPKKLLCVYTHQSQTLKLLGTDFVVQ